MRLPSLANQQRLNVSRKILFRLFAHVLSGQRRAADAEEASGVVFMELPRSIYGDLHSNLAGTYWRGQARVRHVLAQQGVLLLVLLMIRIFRFLSIRTFSYFPSSSELE